LNHKLVLPFAAIRSSSCTHQHQKVKEDVKDNVAIVTIVLILGLIGVFVHLGHGLNWEHGAVGKKDLALHGNVGSVVTLGATADNLDPKKTTDVLVFNVITRLWAS
jgi:hypothetical protein